MLLSKLKAVAAKRAVAKTEAAASLPTERATSGEACNNITTMLVIGFEKLEDPFQRTQPTGTPEDHSAPPQGVRKPAQTSSQIPFLELPGEIRQQIYRYLFCDTQLIYETQIPDHPHVLINGHRAILSTCRTIRHEASSLSNGAIMNNFFRRQSALNYLLTVDQIVNLHRTAQPTVRPNSLLPAMGWIQTLKVVRLLMYIHLHFKEPGCLNEGTEARERIWRSVEAEIEERLTAGNKLWLDALLLPKDRPDTRLWIVCHVAVEGKDMLMVWDWDAKKGIHCVQRGSKKKTEEEDKE